MVVELGPGVAEIYPLLRFGATAWRVCVSWCPPSPEKVADKMWLVLAGLARMCEARTGVLYCHDIITSVRGFCVVFKAFLSGEVIDVLGSDLMIRFKERASSGLASGSS